MVSEYLTVKKNALLFGAVWLLLWLFPWGTFIWFDGSLYLMFLVDMLKLALALALFILPGIWLYLLLRQSNNSFAGLWDFPVIGFALSVTLISMTGIVGRVLGFSFDLVKHIFMFIGVVELILLSRLRVNFLVRKEHILGLLRDLFQNILLLLSLIFAVSMMFNEFLFFIDDTTYAAYSTSWQFADRLGFTNIVHYTGAIENPRFWLALYPMVHALLADISGIPVILLYSNYLEIFLVFLAVVTVYWFARALGVSPTLSGVAALIQMMMYLWMIGEDWPVGFWFFLNMAEDKVSAAFLLSPVFFCFALKYIESQSRNNLLLTLAAGVGLSLTHPAILFFACFIAAEMALLALLVKKATFRTLLPLIVVVVVIILPYLAIRLYNPPSLQRTPFDGRSARDTFQIERYTNIVNDTFYGLNPEVLKFFDISPESAVYAPYQIFRLFPVFLALTAGVLAFARIQNGALYWYVLSSVLLVAFAAIPYTGWILGYFVSARLISRASWFSPLGLAGALVLAAIFERLRTRFSLLRRLKAALYEGRQRNGYAGIAAGFVFFVLMFNVNIFPRLPQYFTGFEYYNALAKVGAYIDSNTPAPVTVVALNYADTQLLPSVSSKANLISFREEKEYNPHNYFLSLEEIRHRLEASNAIRLIDDPSINLEKRCSALKEYNVAYVVASSENVDSFLNLYKGCNERFARVYQTKNIILLQRK